MLTSNSSDVVFPTNISMKAELSFPTSIELITDGFSNWRMTVACFSPALQRHVRCASETFKMFSALWVYYNTNFTLILGNTSTKILSKILEGNINYLFFAAHAYNAIHRYRSHNSCLNVL